MLGHAVAAAVVVRSLGNLGRGSYVAHGANMRISSCGSEFGALDSKTKLRWLSLTTLRVLAKHLIFGIGISIETSVRAMDVERRPGSSIRLVSKGGCIVGYR